LKILKNRIFLSALCIIAAAAVSFVLLPRFYENKDATVMVLRASEDIPAGTKIEDKHLAKVEVGKLGLPEGVINDKTQIVGKIAQTDISRGDYFFSKKLGNFVADEILDRIARNNQRLVTVSVLSIAAGLSSHLQSGDIVTVAVFMQKASSVENSRTQSTAEMRKQQKESQSSSSDPVPRAVTLIVTEVQAEKLIEAEYTGKLHLIFEKRGVSHER
jgi:pilus assembly protein CpaB